MRDVPRNHTHLWNDLPFDERSRLMPHQIESQILHLEQARLVFVSGHKRTLRELDSTISNLKDNLRRSEGASR